MFLPELAGAWHRVVGWSRDAGGLLEITACGWLLPARPDPVARFTGLESAPAAVDLPDQP